MDLIKLDLIRLYELVILFTSSCDVTVRSHSEGELC